MFNIILPQHLEKVNAFFKNIFRKVGTPMAHKTVVRNQAYTRGGAGIRERHNERKKCYSNADIQLEHSPMNVHFKQCEGTYTEVFDKLLADGVISTRGLKVDAKIID
jgi:hypothetical protein